MLLKKINDGTCNHLLTYHNTVSRGKLFADFLGKINKLMYGDKNILYVNTFDGSTPMSKRNKILQDFNYNKKSILCTARVMNEGVNIPVIDSVCFVDQRQSTIDIVQCCGRAFRLFEGKTMAHVFIPCFIENMDDENIENSNFSNTLKILQSLKSTDEDIIEYFMIKTEGKVNNGRKIVKFESITKLKMSEEIKLDKWVNDIECKVWQIIDSFQYKKNILFQYVNKFNRSPKNKERYADFNIHDWFQDQKKKIKNDTNQIYIELSENKIIKENLDKFLKNKEIFNDKIKLTFDEIRTILFDFVNKYNRIPIGNEFFQNYNIGNWLQNQKSKIKFKIETNYIKLSENKLVKDNLNKYLKNKELNDNKIKLTFEQWSLLLFEYVNEFNKIPTWKEKYKQYKLGIWYNHQKNRTKSKENKIYLILSENKLVKKNLDENFKNRELNVNKIKLTFEQSFAILLNYVNKFNKIPAYKEQFQNCKIGSFVRDQKKKINSTSHERYLELSKNKIIKDYFDEFLKNKELNFEKIKLTSNESIVLLFKYVNEFNKIPFAKEKYEKYNIGEFFWRCKKKITLITDELYVILCVNKIIKENLDEYLKMKTQKCIYIK
jgi:antitoxin component of RelBE/YafQ-DinJ toxin-antitoxin module